MKKTFTLIFCFFILTVFFTQAQTDLPKWLTEEEKAIYEEYLRNLSYDDKSTQPPSAPPRTPAEFEEAGGLIITWASYATELREIVRHASIRVPVYIVANDVSQVQNFLNSGGVDMSNVSILQFPFNSVWVRDFGPQSVYLNGTDELAFVDWVYNRPRPDDNLIPANMADYLGLSVFQMTSNPNRLEATGGNFMTDGHGTAFSSKLILTENPNLSEAQIDDIMFDFKGIDRYIKFEELEHDNISHIDMHMKLLDEERILVGEFPSGVSDGPQIEANLDYLLSNYTTTFDRDYEIVYIPMVPSPIGNFPPNAHYRTFTNSLILNDLVLVPNYNNTALNAQAMAIYQEAMPGYDIVGINMENVIGASGAIHCITREIAAEDPIWISHAVIRSIEDYYLHYPVEARISNVSGITSASVFYRVVGQGGFQEIPMEKDGDMYSAIIPSQPCNATIDYYISASNANKTITRPFPGASGPWTFQVGGEPVNFSTNTAVANTDVPVEFMFTGCLDESTITNATWNFGDGAVPPTATGIGPFSVVYETPGAKTIGLTINAVTLTKPDFLLITDATSYSLTVSKEGEGQTQPAPGTHHFNANEEVDLAATPAQGWVFDRWEISGTDDDVAQSDFTLVMDNDRTAKAIFRQVEVSVSEWQNKFMFDVFPNPAPGRFNIVMSPAKSPVTIEIFNITGRKIYGNTVSVTQWDQHYAVDLSGNPMGIYLVKLSYDSGTRSHVKRIVVR